MGGCGHNSVKIRGGENYGRARSRELLHISATTMFTLMSFSHFREESFRQKHIATNVTQHYALPPLVRQLLASRTFVQFIGKTYDRRDPTRKCDASEALHICSESVFKMADPTLRRQDSPVGNKEESQELGRASEFVRIRGVLP